MWAWFIPSFFFSFFLSFRHYKSRLSWIDSRRPNIGRKQNFKSIPALKVENCLLSTHPYQLIQNPIPTWTTIRFRGFETGSKMIKAISFQTDFENRRTRIEKGKTIKPLHESIKSMLGNPGYKSATIKDVLWRHMSQA